MWILLVAIVCGIVFFAIPLIVEFVDSGDTFNNWDDDRSGSRY